MFQEGTVAALALEIGRLQGRLNVSEDWARLNGGFEIIAAPHRAKLEDQIDRLTLKVQKLRGERRR